MQNNYQTLYMKNSIIPFSIVSFFLFGCLCSCHSENEKVNDHKSIILTEDMTAIVESDRPQKTIILPGELKAWEWVDMYAKVKGFVKQVYVDRGSIVKKGQLLAILEAPELTAELSKREADVLEYKAKYKASKATYFRLVQTSKTQGAISENELDVAYSKMLSDSSIVSSVQGSLNSVREMINYLKITAPFDGAVTERNIHPGALVGVEDKVPMFKMGSTDKLRLTVAIPEVYSSEIETKCNIKFSVAAFPEQQFTACMARNSIAIQQDIRSLITELDVENTNHLLSPGMYVELSLPIRRKTATLFVPLHAIVHSTERTFIIKVENHKAKWIDVKQGNMIDDKVEIFSSDVHAGDVIISKASEEIRDGSKL
ncbi:MAG: family efflux transporter subunit [Chitinophagaceae bacterium]|nr:family efflux transporter subunit [Chitinophagaceae bacterium]